jgi:predicted RNase H-like HicB family nuclease
MRLTIESEQEEDGRWLAEATDLPGVLCYGSTREDAITRVLKLAERVIAERFEYGEHLNGQRTGEAP